jgi:hypothetical protein
MSEIEALTSLEQVDSRVRVTDSPSPATLNDERALETSIRGVAPPNPTPPPLRRVDPLLGAAHAPSPLLRRPALSPPGLPAGPLAADEEES